MRRTLLFTQESSIIAYKHLEMCIRDRYGSQNPCKKVHIRIHMPLSFQPYQNSDIPQKYHPDKILPVNFHRCLKSLPMPDNLYNRLPDVYKRQLRKIHKQNLFQFAGIDRSSICRKTDKKADVDAFLCDLTGLSLIHI